MPEDIWRIGLFGRMCAEREGCLITHFRTQRTGALFAYLAYYRSRSHLREALIERFWPQEEPESARNGFRVALNALRRPLEIPGVGGEPVILADRTHVQLNPARCMTDVAQFEKALQAEAQTENDADRTRLLTGAVGLYRGELLPGCEEEWAGMERQRLEDAYLGALRRLARQVVQARDFDRALDYVLRALQIDPLREESHRTLMRLYLAMGRPAAALRQYHELENLLKVEFGVEPSAATRDLAQSLLQGKAVVKSARHAVSAPSSASERPPMPTGNLPARSTRFFGREEEMAQLVEMLSRESRLVTLTGPGGSGKTRLALEVADRMGDAFEGAVWLVELADLTDPDLMPTAIMEAVGLKRSAAVEPLEQVVAFLSGAQGSRFRVQGTLLQTHHHPPLTLLVLDNFEHLLKEGAHLAQALLERVPGLTLLVTSRRRLCVTGEHEFLVLPLPTPRKPGTPERLMEFPSVQLFVDRVCAVKPGFQVSDANASAIGGLCHRLEGIPLAIELAAAWAQVLTPKQMLRHLERRFELLVGGNEDLSPRHRTLRAAMEWSYRLLPVELQRFFARLSVFRGGGMLEAVAAVCEEPRALHYLRQLRERSLVASEEAGEEMRFRLLETLREYGGEQLGEEERAALSCRHADFYRRLAEESEGHVPGPEQAAWMERLEVEHDNLRAALDWYLATEKDAEACVRLAAALGWFWRLRGHLFEGRKRLQEVLARTETMKPTKKRVKAVNMAGVFASMQSDHAAARSYYEQSAALYRDLGEKNGVAGMLSNLGNLARRQGSYAAARPLYEESLAISREIGDDLLTATVLMNMGDNACRQGDAEAGQSLYEQSLALFQQVGDPRGIASVLCKMGEIAPDLTARALLEEALALFRELGEKEGIAHALSLLAIHVTDRGDDLAALPLYEESLRIAEEMGDRERIAMNLEGLARSDLACGRLRRAARLLGAAERLCEAIHTPRPLSEADAWHGCVASVRGGLGEEAFRSAWAAGRSMTLEQMLACALREEMAGAETGPRAGER